MGGWQQRGHASVRVLCAWAAVCVSAYDLCVAVRMCVRACESCAACTYVGPFTVPLHSSFLPCPTGSSARRPSARRRTGTDCWTACGTARLTAWPQTTHLSVRRACAVVSAGAGRAEHWHCRPMMLPSLPDKPHCAHMLRPGSIPCPLFCVTCQSVGGELCFACCPRGCAAAAAPPELCPHLVLTVRTLPSPVVLAHADPAMKLPESGDFLAAWGGIAGLQYALPASWQPTSLHGMNITWLTQVGQGSWRQHNTHFIYSQ